MPCFTCVKSYLRGLQSILYYFSTRTWKRWKTIRLIPIVYWKAFHVPWFSSSFKIFNAKSKGLISLLYSIMGNKHQVMAMYVVLYDCGLHVVPLFVVFCKWYLGFLTRLHGESSDCINQRPSQIRKTGKALGQVLFFVWNESTTSIAGKSP